MFSDLFLDKYCRIICIESREYYGIVGKDIVFFNIAGSTESVAVVGSPGFAGLVVGERHLRRLGDIAA